MSTAGAAPLERYAILVVEAEADVRRFIEENLRLEGYRVVTAADGAMALATVAIETPDLVLLDTRMPDFDGIELTRRFRADSRTATMPIIMFNASSMAADRVLGLSAGADDYIDKPFDAFELTARVRSTLRRNTEARAVSPLTGLPGNVRIEEELAVRVASHRPFAIAYFDLDNFKAFNDAYGFLRGDEVILLLATAMRRAAAGAEPPAFLGHVGGDDFVLVCTPEQVEEMSQAAIDYFDQQVPALHDPEDVARGSLEIRDRQGTLRQFPLVSVSVGIATTERREFHDHREAVAVATEMKGVAKGELGSAIAVDRRSV